MDPCGGEDRIGRIRGRLDWIGEEGRGAVGSRRRVSLFLFLFFIYLSFFELDGFALLRRGFGVKLMH